MNILITGGAGFIGSHLCDYLLSDKNNKLTVIDNFSLGTQSNIQHLAGNDRFRFCNFNILDDDRLDEVFAENNFDSVFHLAANSDIAKSFNDPSTDLKNTFLTTFAVLDKMRKYHVSQFIMASTSAIYGDTSKVLTEDFGPLLPVSHYGAGKLASEAFISSFAENYGIRAWVLRFPNVVGERTTHGIIFDFLRKIKDNKEYLEVLGDGNQNKPYVYVKDLVEAILFVWKNANEKYNCYNIATDTRTLVRDIAKIVLEETNEKREIKYTGGNRGWVGDVPFFSYSLEKIHALGWKAKFTSDEAVREAVKSILKTSY